jgi:hypothetical protein
MIAVRHLLLLLVLLLLGACGRAPSDTNTASTSPTAPAPSPSPKTEFEQNLQYVRNGGFTYIYVVSRKDGKPLESADSAFLRANAPQVVDWVKADGSMKTFIGGTNFNLEEGNMVELKKRFNVEDYTGR